MKNFRSEGKTLNLVAPGGGVVSGSPYIVGGIFAVAMSDADAGDTFVGLVEGNCGLTKDSATTAAAGAAAYFDSSSGLIETADSATNRRIGVWAEAGANGSTNARVRLDGVSFGASNIDLESKTDKIVPVAPHSIATLSAAGNLESSETLVADLADLAHDHTGVTETPIPAAGLDSGAATAGQVLQAVGDGTAGFGTLDADNVQVDDAGLLYVATDVEGCLAEVKAIADAAVPSADLASVLNGEGAALVGVEDVGTYFTGSTVEAVLAEIGTFFDAKLNASKNVVIALGATSGASAADPAWVGADLVSCTPISGNDQTIVSVVIGGDGAVTVTVGGNETAEATFRVVANLA